MSPIRHFISDEAKVVHLAQEFNPSYMREYLKWSHVWGHDPQNGCGLLPPPVGHALQRGSGIFWEVLDAKQGRVQCFQAAAVHAHLKTLMEESQ